MALGALTACAAFGGRAELDDPAPRNDGGAGVEEAGTSGDATPPPAGDAGSWLARVAEAAPAREACAPSSSWPDGLPGALPAPTVRPEPSAEPTGTFTCMVGQPKGECGAEWALPALGRGSVLTFAFRLVDLKRATSGRVPVLEVDGVDNTPLDVDLEVDPSTFRASLRYGGDELAALTLSGRGAEVVVRAAFEGEAGFVELREGCTGSPERGRVPTSFPSPVHGGKLKLGITSDLENASVTVSEVRGHFAHAP